MKAEDFIYKNVATELCKKYPKAKAGAVATAAKVAKNHYLTHGDFKGKAFAKCLEAAEKYIKPLAKAGI